MAKFFERYSLIRYLLLAFLVLLGAVKNSDSQQRLLVRNSQNFSLTVQYAALKATVKVTDTVQRGWSTEMGSGSGVLVGRDSQYTYVLTASHVVSPGNDIDVYLYWREGQQVASRQSVKTVVHRTDHGDVAIVSMQTTALMTGFLPICPKQLAPAGLGDANLSSTFRVPVLSVGCDHGDPPYCWTAYAVGKSYHQCSQRNHPFITTNYPPTKGRSGGPLVSTLGYVVGLCSSKSPTTGSFSSLTEIWRTCDAAGLSWLYNCQATPSVPQIIPQVQPQPILQPQPQPQWQPYNLLQPQNPSCPSCPNGVCPRGVY